jgi:hypothetical protein
MRVQTHYEPAFMRYMLIAAVLGLVLLIASVAAACPTCKEGLAQNDPHGQSIAAGYYYSILFMMAMPFAILGTFGSLAYFSVRRARKNTYDAGASQAGQRSRSARHQSTVAGCDSRCPDCRSRADGS